jgi:hypothetical protein
MTWGGGYYWYIGGESLDPVANDGSANWNGSLPTGWTMVSSPVKHGAGAYQCNVNGSQADGLICSEVAADGIYLSSAWVYLSGSPTAAFPLLGSDADTTLAVECVAGAANYFKVRLVKLASGAGTRWTNRTALTGWSAEVAKNTWAHVALLTDPWTIPSSCRASLLLNSVEVGTVDAGTLVTEFTFLCSAAGTVNAGITVTADDIVGLRSYGTADYPYLTAWPIGVVTRQLPTSNYTASGWTGTPDTVNFYNNWDDPGANDGDTSNNYTAAASKYLTSIGPNAAALGLTGHTVIHDSGNAQLGPALIGVHKIAGSGTKWGGQLYVNGGDARQVDLPGTTYQSLKYNLLPIFPIKTSGWFLTDIDGMYFGFQTGSSHSREWHVTLLQVHWLTYIDTLPLITAPPAAGRRRVFVC